mmetsp:Transcript_10045/g.41440  ORF Transcript_10045/g.41440 Transcript_10045/m.41440 type:complete len:240 (-) Transcript_10045:445-1164(-)
MGPVMGPVARVLVQGETRRFRHSLRRRQLGRDASLHFVVVRADERLVQVEDDAQVPPGRVAEEPVADVARRRWQRRAVLRPSSFDRGVRGFRGDAGGDDPSRRMLAGDGAVVHARERAPGGLVALLAPRRRRVVLVSGVQSDVHLEVLRDDVVGVVGRVVARIVVVVRTARVGSSVDPGALVQPEPRGRVVDVARMDAEGVGLVRVAVVAGRRDDGRTYGRCPRRDHGCREPGGRGCGG